jgi:hypothetical protein
MERQRRLPWRKCRPREKGAAPTLHLPAETILLSLNCLREGNAIRLHLSDQLSTLPEEDSGRSRSDHQHVMQHRR